MDYTEILGWTATALLLVGYYLNANAIISSWLVWMVGNALVGIYSIYKRAYSTAVMSFIIMVMNIYGYVSWLS